AVAVSAIGATGLRPGGDFGPRYRIEKLLGEGGMGAVYKAYDKELDRVVALKTLRAGLSGNPELTQRFKQELLLASRISHKNILRIHDMGDVEGIKFITMAFVEGEDLYGMLRREGKLAPDRLVRIARQLCAALDSAHSEGVIHRDLKPQNVLLDKNENVYVSDFGLAKSLEAGAIGMTRTGEFLGTPRYMSPEQVENKTLDNRSDLYSLGLILYEMATGEVPFTGNSALQVMYMRVKEKPKSPRKVNPGLPDYLERIIMRCLERDPDLRYQSAAEILADIDRNRASSAPASLILSRSIAAALPTKESGTRKWWVAAGVVIVLLTVIFTVPAVRQRIFSTVVTTEGVPLGDLRYVAVLPFRITGDAAGFEHISTGLTEALAAKLFQLKEVRLASAAAVGGIPSDTPLDRMGRQLGVNLIVQGTVQMSGDRIRVIVNLEDVRAQRRLFSQDFSGLAQDLLTLEDQIYNRLVEALELRPSSEELARTTARPTENIEAYDLYLRGRNAMRGSHDAASLEEAIRQFEEAQRKDPNFALAYTGLADASLQLYREKKDQAYATRALGAAQQAQRLNDNLPEVHNVLGSIYQATGRTAEALAELRRAIELAPNSDEGHRRLGAAYAAAGRKDEAIQSFEKAVQINPFLWVNHNALGGAYLGFGDNEKALATFQKVTEIEPDNPVGHENTGNTHLRMGNFAAAIEPYQRAIQIQPHYSTYSNLGTAFFYLDRYNEAVA
ncbi:MAG TPA: protein kinase, partial [Candidatus Acidoferrales bacterium]